MSPTTRCWGYLSQVDTTYVYIWADGIYSNVRLDDERQCLLVVMGALEDGRKQLLAVHDGFRERRCCMIQLRREWGRFSNFSFRTPQRRISAYPARPSG